MIKSYILFIFFIIAFIVNSQLEAQVNNFKDNITFTDDLPDDNYTASIEKIPDTHGKFAYTQSNDQITVYFEFNSMLESLKASTIMQEVKNNRVIMNGKYYCIVNNVKIEEGMFTGNKPSGLWTYRIANDVIKYAIEYSDSSANEVYKYYSPIGTLQRTATFSKGELDGLEEVFSPKGNKQSKTNYKKGYLHGECSFFSPEGREIANLNFHQGNLISVKRYNEEGFELNDSLDNIPQLECNLDFAPLIQQLKDQIPNYLDRKKTTDRILGKQVNYDLKDELHIVVNPSGEIADIYLTDDKAYIPIHQKSDMKGEVKFGNYPTMVDFKIPLALYNDFPPFCRVSSEPRLTTSWLYHPTHGWIRSVELKKTFKDRFWESQEFMDYTAQLNENCKAHDQYSRNHNSTGAYFPGGPQALSIYLNEAIQFPSEAIENTYEGSTTVSFRVSYKGFIQKPKVVDSSGHECLDEEALRVISDMPPWIPYQAGGSTNMVSMSLPVTFSLTEPEESSTFFESKNDSLYKEVEQMPEFAGGQQALMMYLSQNVHYPQYSLEHNEMGSVYVSFIVRKDGSLTNIKIGKTSGYWALDQEGIRVVKNMPMWIPGKQNGRIVDVKYILPINFVTN